MTSDRPYRKGMAAEVAFAEVEKLAGQQFDPMAAEAFLAIRDRIVQEMNFQIAEEEVKTGVEATLSG